MKKKHSVVEFVSQVHTLRCHPLHSRSVRCMLVVLMCVCAHVCLRILVGLAIFVSKLIEGPFVGTPARKQSTTLDLACRPLNLA